MNSKYNKDDLYTKGIEMMQERGYNNTSVKDILLACGVPKGSFYNFFENKEQFASEAVKIYSDALLATINGLFAVEKTPKEKIVSFAECMRDKVGSHDCKRGCLVANLSAEVASELDLIAGEIENFRGQFINLFTQIIEDGQQGKSFSNHTPAQNLAELFYGMYIGMAVSARSARNTNDFDQMITLTNIL